MERHDRHMTPAHSTSDEQGQDVEPSLLTSIGSVGPARRRRRTRRSRSLLLSLSFFSFSSAVTHAFPSPIKREAGRPMKGERIETQEHGTSTRLSGNRAFSTHSLLPPETGNHFPLSSVCNPYCKPSAGNMSSSELDVGTFRPN